MKPVSVVAIDGPAALAPFVGGDPVETLAPAGANHFDVVTPGTVNGDAVADFAAAKAFTR